MSAGQARRHTSISASISRSRADIAPPPPPPLLLLLPELDVVLLNGADTPPTVSVEVTVEPGAAAET